MKVEFGILGIPGILKMWFVILVSQGSSSWHLQPHPPRALKRLRNPQLPRPLLHRRVGNGEGGREGGMVTRIMVIDLWSFGRINWNVLGWKHECFLAWFFSGCTGTKRKHVVIWYWSPWNMIWWYLMIWSSCFDLSSTFSNSFSPL